MACCGTYIRFFSLCINTGWQQLIILTLSDNPITSPPSAMCVSSDKLLTYFADLSKSSVHISRVRLCLVGNGGAGKTTLAKALTATSIELFLEHLKCE